MKWIKFLVKNGQAYSSREKYVTVIVKRENKDNAFILFYFKVTHKTHSLVSIQFRLFTGIKETGAHANENESSDFLNRSKMSFFEFEKRNKNN